ncbi:MAG: lysylphosphatidylglycerol synthase transmembrane domain-containing protein [Salinivirgaceae bacterium]|jgi:uncharacterized protein (TIRG00374 family)|nr:lysylphosphatidylglycerol synthase transmembrane domain-containing protein [Salinivirgaceae bacterium]
MKKALNALKYITFLAIGIFLFTLVYKEYNLQEFISTLKELKWGWVILSLAFAILSHLSRAIRWNMLIHPMGFQPKIVNTFLSVLILYATNLVIPRGGELARCTILSKYEKIPFGKLVGTVFTERATDTILLLLLVFITVFSQIGVFKQFVENNPDFGQNFGFMFSIWFWIALSALGIGSLILIWKLRNQLKRIKIIAKLFELLFNFIDGIKSIRNLERPWAYVAHSVFIYIMYFLMMYVVFLAYKPTENIGILAGLTAFIMGGLAMLMPVQGGIGAWHFMVYETLAIYGLDKLYGREFALISHTSMNLMLLIMGGLSFIIIPLYNRKSKVTA